MCYRGPLAPTAAVSESATPYLAVIKSLDAINLSEENECEVQDLKEIRWNGIDLENNFLLL